MGTSQSSRPWVIPVTQGSESGIPPYFVSVAVCLGALAPIGIIHELAAAVGASGAHELELYRQTEKENGTRWPFRVSVKSCAIRGRAGACAAWAQTERQRE